MKRFIKTFATLVIGMALGSATLAAAAPETLDAVLTKFKVVVNGQEAQLKSTPIVVKGTTYLPVREVASLLKADLVYDGANKKIELNTKGDDSVNQPIVTASDWISLRDLAEKYNFTVAQTSTSNGLFEVRSGDKLLFSIDAKKTIAEGYAVTTTDGKTIHIKLDNTNSTMININDLKEAGII